MSASQVLPLSLFFFGHGFFVRGAYRGHIGASQALPLSPFFFGHVFFVEKNKKTMTKKRDMVTIFFGHVSLHVKRDLISL